MTAWSDIQAGLVELYGPAGAFSALERLRTLVDLHKAGLPVETTGRGSLSEQDAILITYGDQVTQPGRPPLQTLGDFCCRHLPGLVSGVHILPFYPFSSDDGFSVIDYRQVDPALGSWEDICSLGTGFRLMFDAVINHISAGSAWFQAYCAGDPAYQDYFIEIEGSPDLSQVVRPRALPLLTVVKTALGPRQVWTTFSTDQIDLNYHNPAVLLEIIDLLLFYAGKGAEFIRLDAIAYLWKEVGTSCIHLPQTHRVIQLLRSVLDLTYPGVQLISETNVPHPDNIAYFGNGSNEAQLVYNFALPPLVLHALQTGNAHYLSGWAKTLQTPGPGAAFFNFLASHDGIGLNSARGILPDSEIEGVVARALAHGGLVSYKHNPDGSQSPYELNINYFDALSDPEGDESLERQVQRFLAAQAVMLELAGMPGIYFHSLFGSRGWPEGVHLTGRNRTINRQKLELGNLEKELQDSSGRRARILAGFSRMLKARSASPAFHPQGAQEVLELGEAIFALFRTSPDGSKEVLCLNNVTSQAQAIPAGALTRLYLPFRWVQDLITGEAWKIDDAEALALEPYQVKWLAKTR